MNNPAFISAVIARPHGESWTGRYVHAHGAPDDLGPILHRLARNAHADGPDGIDALTRLLLDEHCGWDRLDPDAHGTRLGQCRCHDPKRPALKWPDTEVTLPGRCTADYAYILTPARLEIEVRIGADWEPLDRADYTRETPSIGFAAMVERARELTEAHLWDTDFLN